LPANEAINLTQARATAIKTELTQRGIAESRISTSGKGSANPIGDNSTPEGRALNNRIIAKFN
jgi:outer membrane protein OmpA-like peptidoglycan-associated protein